MLKKLIPSLLSLSLLASVEAAPVAGKITQTTEAQNKEIKKQKRDYKKYLIAAALVAAGAGTALALVNYAPNYCPTILKKCTPDWCIKKTAKIAYLTMEQPSIEAAIKTMPQEVKNKIEKLENLYNEMKQTHTELEPLITQINTYSTKLAKKINTIVSYNSISYKSINQYEFSEIIKQPRLHTKTQQSIAKKTRELKEEAVDCHRHMNNMNNQNSMWYQPTNKIQTQNNLTKMDKHFKALEEVIEQEEKLAATLSDNLYDYQTQLKKEKAQTHRLKQTYSDRFRKYKKLQGQEPNPFNNQELHVLIKTAEDELKALPS